MKKRFMIITSAITMTLLFQSGQGVAYAQTTQHLTPIVITEMMPGTSVSGSQEFIELYNQSDTAIDLAESTWTLQIASSKATSWDKAKNIRLSGVMKPGAYALLSSTYVAVGESKSYLQDFALAQFTPGLTASSGHIRLIMSEGPAKKVVDQLEWTILEDGNESSPSIDGRQPKRLDAAIQEDGSLKRRITHGIFHDTNNNASDFLVAQCSSPTALWEPDTIVGDSPIATDIDTENQSCEPPFDGGPSEEPIPVPTDEPPVTILPSEQPVSSSKSTTPSIPAANNSLVAPQLTELLPNPGSPQTDAQDEFVELYNSNNAVYDLSGYMLVSGTTSAKKYTFPNGTIVQPKQFMAFFSGDTKLSLSNSSGQVRLLDPLGREISSTDVYGTAKDNQAWARANGSWQWTTTPTPNGTNAIQAPAAKKTSSASAAKKTTTNKAATKQSQKDKQAVVAAGITDEPDQKTPLHPLALAVVGGFALLYGAYEYRHDMANKLYQLRRYREARREARTQLEGR